jgi:hypothetical protein
MHDFNLLSSGVTATVIAALLMLLGATRRWLATIFRMAPIHGGGELISVVTDHHKSLFGGMTTLTTGC